MKLKILFIFVVFISSCGILAFQGPNKSSPARSIFTVSVNPLACKESEVYYNMTSHAFLVCTGLNTLSTVSFGANVFSSQLANVVLAGPASGSLAQPTFRNLVANDIPSLSASKITSGVFPVERLGTGTPDGTKFLRDDGVFVTPSGSGNVTLAGIETFTGAHTFNATKLIIGVNNGAPTVIANSLYRDSSDGKLYIGAANGAVWNELFEAGVSLVNLSSHVTGVLPNSNGGRTKASGAPVGSCTTGDLYTRTDGSVGSTLYVCENGNWSAK